jgi:hypothetical protein
MVSIRGSAQGENQAKKLKSYERSMLLKNSQVCTLKHLRICTVGYIGIYAFGVSKKS